MLRDPPTNIWAVTNPGSGKTLASAVALISRIDPAKKYTQALCIVDSSEVAVQTTELVKKLSICTEVEIGVTYRSNRGN